MASTITVTPSFVDNTLYIESSTDAVFTPTDQAKLDGIEEGANANTYSLSVTDDGAGIVTVQLVES